jgi:hypothetical protein
MKVRFQLKLYSLNLMDQSAVSYFLHKFGTYDAEELGDLVSRRSGLSDEAVEALNLVLAEKGLKDSDVFAVPQPKPSRTPEQEETHVKEQTKTARELWRSWLSKSCKGLVALIFIAPAQVYLTAVSYGALLNVLIVLIAVYTGYSVGHAVTKNICANAEVSVQVKKRKLWIMFAVLLPFYFLVYVVSFAVFGRA